MSAASTTTALVLAALAGLFGQLQAGEEAWAVPTASWRLRVEPAKDAANVGSAVARVWPQIAEIKGVAVTGANGGRVPCRVLWSAPGEPIDVAFDTPAAGACFVYCSDQPISGAEWEAKSGVILETRRLASGAVDTWDQFQALWKSCTPVLGRSVVAHIFDGVHRHGPTSNFCSWYQGWLELKTAGEYHFATMSDDASFLLIDGKMIAQWPGWHGLDGGRRAQFNGAVNLTAGRHRIDYWNAQNEAGFSLAAAWMPPGEKTYTVIPPDAFAPIARYQAVGCETRGQPNEATFAWTIAGHTQVGELGLVSLEVHALAPDKSRRYRWTFADGQGAEGVTVVHPLRPGMQPIKLAVFAGDKPIGGGTLTVNVHAQWSQIDECPEPLLKEQFKAVGGYDLSALPMADLAHLLRFLDRLHERPLLSQVGEAALKRKAAFTAADADALVLLGYHYQHQEVARYDLAEESFRAALACPGVAPALAATTGLHFGGFLADCLGDVDKAAAVLGAVAKDKLNKDEQRLLAIYRGDAAVLAKAVDQAREFYNAAGTAVNRADTLYAARRRTRLEYAKDQLAKGDFDEAERILREIEWETPLERLGTETGLVLVGAWMGRKEYAPALTRCLVMLIAAPDDPHRPDVLLALARVQLARGDALAAAGVVKQLVADHPYSEAAARGKDLIATASKGPKP